MTGPWRLIGVLALVLAGFGSAWQFQDWRYGRQLAEQAVLNGETLNQLATAGADAQKAEQEKRLALEQRLAANEQTHYRKLSDAQRDQDRLRDRLATADLRLSVLIDAGSASACDVPKAPGACSTNYRHHRHR